MRLTKGLLALSLIAAATPALADREDRPATAPAGGPDTRYCMRIEALTGTITEQVKCWTREQWSEQGVDVDRAWPKEGVRVKG